MEKSRLSLAAKFSTKDSAAGKFGLSPIIDRLPDKELDGAQNRFHYKTWPSSHEGWTIVQLIDGAMRQRLFVLFRPSTHTTSRRGFNRRLGGRSTMLMEHKFAKSTSDAACADAIATKPQPTFLVMLHISHKTLHL
jgi:hypothetical protein